MMPRTAGSAASSSTNRWIASFTRRTYLPEHRRPEVLCPATDVREKPCLIVGVVGNVDLRAEHAVGAQYLFGYRTHTGDHALQLFRIERLRLAGGAGKVPRVRKDVAGDDHVDRLRERLLAERRLHLLHG